MTPRGDIVWLDASLSPTQALAHIHALPPQQQHSWYPVCRDGLVHVSHLADTYVADPSKVVPVGKEVMVTVLEVDRERGRISLSMKRDALGTGEGRS